MNVMFDTNVFNHLVEGRIDPADIPKCWRIFVTQIQKDEISRTSNCQKRKELENLIAGTAGISNIEQVDTKSFVLNVSRLDCAELSDGTTFDTLISLHQETKCDRKTADALIGETALKNNLVLVTNDAALKKAIQCMGGQFIDLVSP